MAERLIGKDGRPVTGDVRMIFALGTFFGGVIFAAGLGGFITDSLVDGIAGTSFGTDFKLLCAAAVSVGGVVGGGSALAMRLFPHKRPF